MFFRIGMVFISILAACFIGIPFRREAAAAKKAVFLLLCSVNIVVYFLHQLLLAAYHQNFSDTGEILFVINALPFHLCSINLLLLPVAFFSKRKFLRAFAFFIAPLGGAMAILFPDAFFASILPTEPVFLFFLLYHALLIICGLLFFTMNLYIPTYRDILPVSLFLIFLSVLSFLLNLFFQWTGYPSNFFFSMSPAGNTVLTMLFSFISVPLLYLYSVIPAALLYFAFITFLCRRLVCDSLR